MGRQNISTGGPWEGKLGYSRAVRVGASIYVSGSTAMTASGLVGKGDPYAQTIQTLKKIEAAIQQAGASLADVVAFVVSEEARWLTGQNIHAGGGIVM